MLRWVLAVCVLVSAALPAHADKVDADIAKVMKAEHVPGVSIAVVKNGRIVKLAPYGVANVEHGVKVTPATRFEIASMSKMFIATAIRMLADEGKLDLEDPVSKYLDGLPAAWKALRIRHLVAMSTGLPEDWDLMCWCDVRDEYDDKSMLAALAKLKPVSPIGERFHYSSPGYAMLGMIVTKVTGKPFADFVTQRIFAPAGMTETTYNDPAAVIAARADGYRFEAATTTLRRGFYVAPYMHARADVGILTTPRDLVKWLAALEAGKLVKDPDRLFTTFSSDDGKHDLRYAYGWFTALIDGHRAVLHSGGFRTGFASQIMRFPDDHLALIMTTNCIQCGHQAIATLVRAYLKTDAAPTKDSDTPGTERLIKALQAAATSSAAPDPATFGPDALSPIADELPGLKTATITFRARHALAAKQLTWHGHELADYVDLRVKLAGEASGMGLQVYRDAQGVVYDVEPTP